MNHSANAAKASSATTKIFFASIVVSLLLSPVISAGRQDRKPDSTQPQTQQRVFRAQRAKPQEPATPTQAETQQQTQQSSAESNVPTTSIPCNAILFLGDVLLVPVHATGYLPNSTETFTTVQTNPGTVGFSGSQAGPFVESFQFSITMDGSGQGFYNTLYTKGLTVGFTTTSLTSPNTITVNTIDYNVINHCNCPPIPVIP